MSAYVDGVLKGSTTATFTGNFSSANPFILGNYTSGSYYYNGYMDEVAIWSRSLAANEVAQLYQRGASRIKFQVQSCSTAAACATSPGWVGPDGTSATYFSELNNNSPQMYPFNSLFQASLSGLPNLTFANYTNAPSTNRYFQYRAYFESDQATTTLMPEVKSVAVGPTHYDSSSPSVVAKTGVSFNNLSSILQILGANGCSGGSGVLYNLGVGASAASATWYWYNIGTSTWSPASGTAVTASSYAAINSGLSTFGSSVGTGAGTAPGNQTVYLQMFLSSPTGTTPCEIQSLQLMGGY